LVMLDSIVSRWRCGDFYARCH